MSNEQQSQNLETGEKQAPSNDIDDTPQGEIDAVKQEFGDDPEGLDESPSVNELLGELARGIENLPSEFIELPGGDEVLQQTGFKNDLLDNHQAAVRPSGVAPDATIRPDYFEWKLSARRDAQNRVEVGITMNMPQDKGSLHPTYVFLLDTQRGFLDPSARTEEAIGIQPDLPNFSLPGRAVLTDQQALGILQHLVDNVPGWGKVQIEMDDL